MSGPSRWSEMTDTDVEELIRRLPLRQPAAEVRERVLAVPQSARRRPSLLRPAVAFGTLAVLIVLDLLALGAQERRLAGALPSASAATIARKPDEADSLRDLEDGGMPYLSARLHLTRDDGETYWQLRTRLLETGEGG
jgi:hypothetical protein